MNEDLISVVIPSYFHERYLKEAVFSVLDQTWSNLELIVVDDGSRDRSLLILDEFKDKRMKVFPQRNQGAHNAINAGLGRCVGKYITILNSDDRFHPDRFRVMIDHMRSEKADFSCSWIQQMDSESRPGPIKMAWENELPSWADNFKRIDVPPNKRFIYELIRTNFVSTTSNMVFTRDLYSKVGGMKNLRFAHDWDFAFRAACFGKCIVTPHVLMQYRSHGSNTIKSNKKWMLFEICWILATHLGAAHRLLPEIDSDMMAQLHYGQKQPVFKKLMSDLANHPDGGLSASERLLNDEDARAIYMQEILD